MVEEATHLGPRPRSAHGNLRLSARGRAVPGSSGTAGTPRVNPAAPPHPALHRCPPPKASPRRAAPCASVPHAPPFRPRPQLDSPPRPARSPSFRFPFIFMTLFIRIAFFPPSPLSPPHHRRQPRRSACGAAPGAAPASPRPGGCRRDVREAGAWATGRTRHEAPLTAGGSGTASVLARNAQMSGKELTAKYGRRQ